MRPHTNEPGTKRTEEDPKIDFICFPPMVGAISSNHEDDSHEMLVALTKEAPHLFHISDTKYMPKTTTYFINYDNQAKLKAYEKQPRLQAKVQEARRNLMTNIYDAANIKELSNYFMDPCRPTPRGLLCVQMEEENADNYAIRFEMEWCSDRKFIIEIPTPADDQKGPSYWADLYPIALNELKETVSKEKGANKAKREFYFLTEYMELFELKNTLQQQLFEFEYYIKKPTNGFPAINLILIKAELDLFDRLYASWLSIYPDFMAGNNAEARAYYQDRECELTDLDSTLFNITTKIKNVKPFNDLLQRYTAIRASIETELKNLNKQASTITASAGNATEKRGFLTRREGVVPDVVVRARRKGESETAADTLQQGQKPRP